MKRLLKPVALNERSYNVNLLHKTLGALGLMVDKNETAEVRAGEDTINKLRTLQEKFALSVDEFVLIDEATTLEHFVTMIIITSSEK